MPKVDTEILVILVIAPQEEQIELQLVANCGVLANG